MPGGVWGAPSRLYHSDPLLILKDLLILADRFGRALISGSPGLGVSGQLVTFRTNHGADPYGPGRLPTALKPQANIRRKYPGARVLFQAKLLRLIGLATAGDIS